MPAITLKDSIYIGTGTKDDSALAQFDSTTQGTAVPRMTTTQRDAIVTPITGLEIYNTTTGAKNIYNGSSWVAGGLSVVGFADFDTDVSDTMKFADGAYLDNPTVVVTSDGATITLAFEDSGGGDVRVIFSAGVVIVDCTPTLTATLTAGSDTAPMLNYAYILESAPTVITISTSGFPVTRHAPVATVLCQSAASMVPPVGPYKVHAWTNHMSNGDGGHLDHLNSWVRKQNATWEDGVNQTYTITTNGGSADNVIFTSSSGTVLQLHDHTFPAFSGTPDMYVVNGATAYAIATDLNTLLTDSASGSMSGRRFSLVVWGVVSQDTGDCKLYVNLPSGSYNSDAAVIADSSKFSNYTIPSEFTGTGFLISEWKLRHQTSASGTWSNVQQVNLRGQPPTIGAGGGVAGSTEFEDSTFKILAVADNTKEIIFDASNITTATTRTITMPDADVTLGGGGVPTVYQNTFKLTSNLDNTTSTYADIDATNIKQTVTLTGGETIDVVYFFSNVIQITGGTGTYKLVADTTDADSVIELEYGRSANAGSLTLLGRWTGLGAGTFDFKPQFKTSANTARVETLSPVSWKVFVYA